MERLRQTHSKEIESKDDEVEEIRQSCSKKVREFITHTCIDNNFDIKLLMLFLGLLSFFVCIFFLLFVKKNMLDRQCNHRETETQRERESVRDNNKGYSINLHSVHTVILSLVSRKPFLSASILFKNIFS